MSTPDTSATPTEADRRPQVLFVCVHNAGRSQMAAALLEHHAAGRVDVRSAGSTPADEINPAVRAAMAEIGNQPRRRTPQTAQHRRLQTADVVVTMGCGHTCPIFPGKRYLDWDLTDPAGKTLDQIDLSRNNRSGWSGCGAAGSATARSVRRTDGRWG